MLNFSKIKSYLYKIYFQKLKIFRNLRGEGYQIKPIYTSRSGLVSKELDSSVIGHFEFKDLVLFVTLAGLSYLVCFCIVSFYKDFWDVFLNGGDNTGYIRIAQGISVWDANIIGKVKLFWGTSYATLAVHYFIKTDFDKSLLLLSIFTGAVGIIFTYKLYGRIVAALFIFVSASMMQRILYGGSEPLFMSFFLGSLILIRMDSLKLATITAAISTTIKPIGIFLVGALFFTVIRQKNWRDLKLYSLILISVGTSYSLPMVFLTGSPFGNISGYSEDWHQNMPISIPFLPIFKYGFVSQAPFSNTLKISFWIFATIFIVTYFGFWQKRLRDFYLKYPEETIAYLLIIIFQFSYNSPWAWECFPRFIAPVIPFLLALINLRTLHSVFLLVAAPIFGLLAAIQTVGFKEILLSLHDFIGL